MTHPRGILMLAAGAFGLGLLTMWYAVFWLAFGGSNE